MTTTHATSVPAQPPATVEPMKVAMQIHLQALIAKPVTARSLLEIEKTARLAREMLAVVADPRSLRPRRVPYFGGNSLDYEFQDDESGGLVMAPSAINSAETFGAQAIRELIPALTGANKKPPPPPIEEMLLAIATAKEQGLDEIAAELRASLLDRVKPPSPVATSVPDPIHELEAGVGSAEMALTGGAS